MRQEMVRRLGKTSAEADRVVCHQKMAVTVMPVVKRRQGEALTAKLDQTQCAQVLLHGLNYNLKRLVLLEAIA
ncbi:hypothetical protein JMJ56_20795 [Belnapia sp. T18]|uniref:Transposase DDE domain-containing protein n=1 Tax=Belnapia arida TaxID=2804533 RepID=A0ABS1U7F1_9PROT|nr:hypothetical protein [Belnapia arida]MBL6080460.1 hypothetical protein [Belnapia arida]